MHFLTGKGYNFGGDGPGTVVVCQHIVGCCLGVLVHCVIKEEVIQVLLLVWKIMVVYQQSEKLAMKFEVHQEVANAAGDAHGEPQNKGKVHIRDGKKEGEQADCPVAECPVVYERGYGVA